MFLGSTEVRTLIAAPAPALLFLMACLGQEVCDLLVRLEPRLDAHASRDYQEHASVLQQVVSCRLWRGALMRASKILCLVAHFLVQIYFRAWRAATGAYLDRIEVINIVWVNSNPPPLTWCRIHSDLSSRPYGSCHSCPSWPKRWHGEHHSRSKRADRLFRHDTHRNQVLDGIHSHKKERGVDEALVRLYEPILWRALKVGPCRMRFFPPYRSFVSCLSTRCLLFVDSHLHVVFFSFSCPLPFFGFVPFSLYLPSHIGLM